MKISVISSSNSETAVKALTFVILNPNMPAFANSEDPDQLAPEEVNWSGSALFAIQYLNLYQQPWSSKMRWVLIYSAWKGLIWEKDLSFSLTYMCMYWGGFSLFIQGPVVQS